MTESSELDSNQKRLRRIVEQLTHMCSKLNYVKVMSSCSGKTFHGWTVRIADVNHNGTFERSAGVFDAYLRISKTHHDVELVLSDADGTTVYVLSCKHLERVDLLGKRRHRSYKIVTEGATLVLAA
jgi:hypothetical protein